MIVPMATVRITEAELALDLVVEQDHRPVAVIRRPSRSGRSIGEIVRQARQRNSTVMLDPDFGKDLESVIANHQQSCNPPSWE
jgi:hypothetical protein